MKEDEAPVSSQGDLKLSELLAVSGLTIGSARAIYSLLFESTPLNEDSELKPSVTAAILAFDTLERLGYARDRIPLVLRPFLSHITKILDEAESWTTLVMLSIYDGRFVTLEGVPQIFDLKEARLWEATELNMPIPMVVVSLSVLSLYLRTASRCRGLRARAEAGKSAAQATATSAEPHPAEQSQAPSPD